MSCFQCKRTGEKVCDPTEAEIKCMICGFCERAYQELVKGFETVMPVQCIYCLETIGYKDGRGVTGISSGICDACKTEHYPAREE